MTDNPMTPEAAEALLAGTTPDWCVYGEPEVGLPSGLFAGKVGCKDFGPIEPLQGRDLYLAAAAPDLARAYLAECAAHAETRKERDDLAAAKWVEKHTDTMNDRVLAGLARETAEAEIARLNAVIDQMQVKQGEDAVKVERLTGALIWARDRIDVDSGMTRRETKNTVDELLNVLRGLPSLAFSRHPDPLFSPTAAALTPTAPEEDKS